MINEKFYMAFHSRKVVTNSLGEEIDMTKQPTITTEHNLVNYRKVNPNVEEFVPCDKDGNLLAERKIKTANDLQNEVRNFERERMKQLEKENAELKEKQNSGKITDETFLKMLKERGATEKQIEKLTGVNTVNEVENFEL